MKVVSIVITFLLFNFLKSQNVEIRSFNLKEFDSLLQKSCPMDCEIKTYHNSNFISFKRKDSVISMSYNKDGISSMRKVFGNYRVWYEFHPNLKIKSKKEFLSGISQIGIMQVGIEREYDTDGRIIHETDWENVPYDTDIPGPNINVWQIVNQIKKDFNFDILFDESFFSIQIYQDEVTKKVNYGVVKFISDNNDKLKLLTYYYDGENGKFIKKSKSETELPPGGLVHY
ncbi:hypothetical protein J3D55_004193 [Chryseobacterium ginsenosidimutans]|uniref:hypothetical protein n=1 Tax=Chryseobacterium ginsenosidimutans TaxID=687846 RepID=UPI002169BED7|nr:hypothetical protein [Chryseobacterium ginsenosidimutans]MCS3871277.1 hypothetical protein [Chryseobacterium ginsenosidimutans]